MPKPLENIPIPRLYCGTKTIAMGPARRLASVAGAMLMLCSICSARPNSTAKSTAKSAAAPAFTEKQLEKLSRALKEPNASLAYVKLGVIASRKSSGTLGLRAALALGYYDYTKGNYVQGAKWLARAEGEPLVADYALYWAAETDLASGHSAEALAELKRFRSEYPDSVMTDAALQSLGDAAIAANQPAEAVAALDAYSQTTQRPALLLLARRGARTSREAAGCRRRLSGGLPAICDQRAGASGRDEARLPAQRALARIIRLSRWISGLPMRPCYSARKAGTTRATNIPSLCPNFPAPIASARNCAFSNAVWRWVRDPAKWWRCKSPIPMWMPSVWMLSRNITGRSSRNLQMVAAVEGVVSRAPSSHWAESALFSAGNYYWVQLDRDRAAGYYKRLEENFPTSTNATSAQWRVAWTAVLKRQPEAAVMLQDHLRRFPGSPYTPDALYWLGRLAEEAGVAPLARGYYAKLAERYPQNYFETQAAPRVRAMGAGPVEKSDVLDSIPPVSAIPKLDGPIPLAAVGRQARANALRSIGFDASAELELRAGFAATGEPRLLLEAAQSAAAAGHYGAAIVTVRQIFPQLESQPFSDVPRDVWRVAYALPFEASIRHWSAKAGVDPMLVAGLIRQESAFEPEARSGKSAIGLMQLIAPTARLLAKQEKIRYSRAKLVDPDYNVRLGAAYLAGLEKQFGGAESALAAYNAGEDRVTLWTSGQSYRETAEFVDSIPFTETRQYVQIVTRNADIYRRLYGAQPDEPRSARTRPGR